MPSIRSSSVCTTGVMKIVIFRKYNTATIAATHVRNQMTKRVLADFALGADWTSAASDVTVSREGDADGSVARNCVRVYGPGNWTRPDIHPIL